MTTPGDAPQPKPRKRMLPAVSDVVQELGKISTASPEILFKIARQVCAEELNKVKQGLESAPLDILVRRAQHILHPELAVPAPPPPTPASVRAADSEDPFNETTGALDLKPLWARQKGDVLGEVIPPNEPLAVAPEPEPAPPPAPPAAPAESPSEAPVTDEAFALAAHEEPPMHGQTFELEPEPESKTEILPTHAAETSSAETEEQEEPEALLGEGAPTAHVTTLQPDGPGEQTLSRLAQEAGSVDLASAMRGLESSSETEESAGVAPGARREVEPLTRPGFTVRGAQATDRSHVGRVLLAMAGILLLAGGGIYAWLQLGSDSLPASLAPLARRKPGARPAPPVPAASPAAVQPSPAPAGAAAPTAPPTPPTEAPRAATPAPKKVAVRTPISRPEPTLAPPSAPPPAPAPVMAARSSAGSPRTAALATKDWAGKEPVYAIHFSSYQSREKAAKDAEKLAKEFGKTAHAFEVDLGEKGIWYRSVLGEFATAEEALAFRAELEAKGTPNMGFVYRVVGK